MLNPGFISRWKNYFKYPSSKIEFPVTIFLLVITVYSFSRYLLFNEGREGAVLDDPILRHFSAIDLNTLIFIAIYSSLLMGLIYFSFNPEQMMVAFQTYTLLILFRMSSMYLVPLEPPQGSIDLADPVVFIFGTGQKIIKDLFFSGHTSTAFLLFQVTKNKYLKAYFLIATITVGISVILQKAHYTIDIYAGLVYSFTSFQIIKSLYHKIHKKLY